MKQILVSLVVLLCVVARSTDAKPHGAHSDADYATHIGPPEYPVQARLSALQGAGIFALHIRPDGTVESVEIIKSIGNTMLNQAAINAFRQWRFRPNTIKVARIPICFTIRAPGVTPFIPSAPVPRHRRCRVSQRA